MSNKAVNINAITANTLLASTFSQWAYFNPGDKPLVAPAGYDPVPITSESFKPTSPGFSAVTFVNKETGQVVIAYRGSDTNAEKLMAGYSASTGTWDPQFTDATNYAKQARAAALDQINDYRDEQGQPRLQEKDINPLVTGHSLGGLLGQVVSKRGIGVRFQLNPPASTTRAVNVDGLCFALKNIAKKPIRTRPRGQFSPKSPHAKACTHQRRPHHLSLQGVNLP